MPKQVTDIDVLKKYFQGVMDKANHHAQNVNEVILPIVGGVIWRKDDEALEVMEREGEMKNVLWFKVGGTRYAFSFNHDTNEIELRQGTTQGNVIASFSNTMTNNNVKQVFERL
jgi:hypothetical protein